MKASDLFVKALENEGVEYIFGVPGEENLDFIESLKNSSIQLITGRHEQCSAFMAATFGRLTGKTGVCIATLGPGATNLVTAAAYAELGGMPMLMITGQKPIKKSKQGKFQIVDVVEMMKPLTKFTKQVVDGHTLPPLIRQCFRLAEQERPGAVHLELPEDIAKEDSECPIYDIHPVIRPQADESVLKQAIDLIKQATRPLILIGAGANRKDTSQALTALIDKTGIPFFNTQMGKGVIDERNPLFMGTAALSDGDYVHRAIARADLIINIGHDIIEKPPFFMHHGGTEVIHINFSLANIDEVYFPQLEVVGDLNMSVIKLTEGLSKQEHWCLECFTNIKSAIETHVLEGSDDSRFPISPPRIVSDVRKAMPSDSIIALDNGMYKIWFARNYFAHGRNTVLLDNALATMGAGLPSAMAAKMVHPDKAVMAICGDGGFMMNCQEVETAVRLKLHLLVLILHDSAYGMIKWKQENMHLQDYGLDFGNPDFVQFAQSFGAMGHRVEKTDELVTILEKCLQTPAVHIIDVPVDYSENSELLGEKLKLRTQGL